MIGVPLDDDKELLLIIIEKPKENIIYKLSRGERPIRYCSILNWISEDKELFKNKKENMY
ncbi:MAG: hypothetical protein ACTSYM_08915 [Candidatus Baldrarchaeia archaeon]